jgi:hypothetical protein
MSLKRSHAPSRSSFGAGDPGAKVNRQELFDHLKKVGEAGSMFTPVDVALAIGAGEPQVARALLGLAAEGCVEKMDAGKYKVAPMFADLNVAEFLKVYARASKVDTTRQRDLSEIARLKQNNDIMRARLLQAIAERDHYLAALKKHGIDPGPAPVAAASAEAAASAASAEADAAEEAAGGDADLPKDAAAAGEGAPGSEPPGDPSGHGEPGDEGGLEREAPPAGAPDFGNDEPTAPGGGEPAPS